MFEFLKDKTNELLKPKPILGKDLPTRIYPPALDDYILIGGPPTKSDTPVPDIAFGGQVTGKFINSRGASSAIGKLDGKS